MLSTKRHAFAYMYTMFFLRFSAFGGPPTNGGRDLLQQIYHHRGVDGSTVILKESTPNS